MTFGVPENQPASQIPQVSILVALYNSEPHLRRTLDSIRAQTFTHFQCLLSDDGSKDRTMEICEGYAGSDSRFTILRNTENLGWIGNVNRLLDRVGSPFFMFMPHDDALDPEYLERLLETLRTNPEAILAFSDMEFIKPGEESHTIAYHINLTQGSARQRSTHLLRRVPYWWIAYRGVVRAALAGNEVRLRRNLAGEAFADRTWILDLAMRGTFVRYPRAAYKKYLYPSSVSGRWKYNLRENLASLLSCMKAVLESPLPFADKCQLIVLLKFKMAGQSWHRLKRVFKSSSFEEPDRHNL